MPPPVGTSSVNTPRGAAARALACAENAAAQTSKRAVFGARSHVHDVRIETSDQVLDDVRQCGPLAIDRLAFRFRVEPFRIYKVGIDETGEYHPSQHSELEGNTALAFVKLEWLWKEIAGSKIELGSPDGIELRNIFC